MRRGHLSASWLESRLQKLFVQAGDPESKIQLMTMHKAKGLEFDHVIIPGLQRERARRTKDAFENAD